MKKMNWIKRISCALGRFRDDQEGAVTMEFIIMLPLLFTWGVGSFLYYDAYRSLSITNKVGFTVTDIASRYEVITESDLVEWQELADRMLPFRNVNNRLRISSICFYDGTEDGNPDENQIVWSSAQNVGAQVEDESGNGLVDSEGNPLLEGAPRTGDNLPAAIPLMADQDTVLYVELFSTWRPLSNSIFGLEFTEKTWFVDLFIRPRFVQSIPFIDENGDELTTPCEFETPPTV